MGVLGSRGEYSTKWINAEIDDSHGKRSIVHIQKTYGDYFFVVLDGFLYAFKIDYRRIKTRIIKATKSYRMINYDTTHYLPIAADSNELKQVIELNHLPKIDGKLFSIMEILGRRESNEEFTAHDVKKILDEVAKKEDEYSTEIQNMITYLDHLQIKKIVTPVRGISEYIKDDLLATDPKFMGTLLALRERADKGQAIITNNPIGAKKSYAIILAIGLLVTLVGVVLYYAYDSGAFDDILKLGAGLENIEFPNIGGIAAPPSSFTDRYPTPEAAKAALDAGQITESQIPPAMRDLVKNVKVPEVKVELGG